MLTKVRQGYSYLVTTRVNANAAIGHTITLYGAEGGQVWVHDPQQLNLPSLNAVCEAWESGTQVGSTVRAGCYVNVKTGKRDGDWEV
jgi:hypothetical protein